MGEFDRTDSSYIENKIEQSNIKPQIGRVIKVYEHTSSDDFSNFEVDLTLRNEQQPRRKVPIMASPGGMMEVPKVDDLVVVGFVESASESPVVIGRLYNTKQRAPLGKENMTRYKKGDLYFEMQSGKDEADSDAEWIRISKKSADDKYTQLPATIEIDDTPGEDTIIKVKGNEAGQMGLELNLTTGEFKLGDGSGYGIVSDGNGNFKWYEKDVTFVEDGSTITW